MQAAITKHGEWIYAWNAERGRYYICPECRHKVICRHGQYKQPYFAHTDHQHDHGGPETAEHVKGKKQLFDWLTSQGWQVEIEHYLGQIQQRPDIMAQRDGQRLIIEFQCSPLSVERLAIRNNGYRQIGIPFYWYLGSPYRIKLRRIKQAQFTQLMNGRPTLLFWDADHCQPLYRVLDDRVTANSPRYSNAYALDKLSYYRPQLARIAYQHHYMLAGCPWLIHRRDPDLKLIAVDEFSWRLSICLSLEKLPLASQHDYDWWERWLYHQTNWLAMPCINPQIVNKWRRQRIASLFQDLVFEGCLQQINNRFALISWPHWFENSTAKMAALISHDSANRLKLD